MMKKKLNKKAQYYLFTAAILIVYAIVIIKPTQEIFTPGKTLENMKQNFEEEGIEAVNNALIESRNVSKAYSDFITQFIRFGKLNNVDLELLYILVQNDQIQITNKIHNSIFVEQTNQTLAEGDEIIVSHENITNYVSFIIDTDSTGRLRYLFEINDEPYQLKYFMRAQKGEDVQIYTSIE